MTQTVTPRPDERQRGDMGTIGYLIAAGTLLLLIPLVPFLAALKLLDVVTGGDRMERAVGKIDRRPEVEPIED